MRRRPVRAAGLLLGLAALLGARASAGPAAPPPLVLERVVPLTDVSGRIDHLAIDPAHGRLFVAELGFGAVEALDLASGRSLGRVTGLKEPQGVAYAPGRDEVAVATGGDGMVRFYRAADLSLVGSVRLGADADNLRLDAGSDELVAGYGGGGLAIIDWASRRVTRTIALPAHPESFQLIGDRAVVNLPNAGAVGVVDLTAGRLAARWPNRGAQFNFPLAVDRQAGVVAVVYRLPGTVVLFRIADGAVVQTSATCGDADDVFFDTPRRRLYVVCGGGAVDVLDTAHGLASIARVQTRGGARTGLFTPDLDRLIVAARAGAGRPAELLVFRPAP